MSYFWENDIIELRMVKEDDQFFFMDILQNTRFRMQANHGILLPQGMQDAQDMTSYAAEFNQSGEELWFLIRNKEEIPVGYAVVDWINEKMGNVQCHVTILEEHRRRGYGSATIKLLLEYLFYERRFEKVGCCILENCAEYLEFAGKNGFTTDAFRRELFYINGTYVGEYYLSILRKEYVLWKKQGFPIKNVDVSSIPQSTLGIKETQKQTVKLPLYDARDNFWSYDGITLREMREDDYLKNHEMVFDTDSCILYDSEVKLPAYQEELSEHELAHIALQNEDNRIEFAMDNENGDYVGNINLCGIDQKNGKFSFSIYTLPEYRGNGYGKKALRLIMTYCFEELRMHKMISCVNDGNIASAVLMRSVGCKVEGVLRHDVYYHGEYVDVVLFGVTREEFYEAHDMKIKGKV